MSQPGRKEPPKYPPARHPATTAAHFALTAIGWENGPLLLAVLRNRTLTTEERELLAPFAVAVAEQLGLLPPWPDWYERGRKT